MSRRLNSRSSRSRWRPSPFPGSSPFRPHSSQPATSRLRRARVCFSTYCVVCHGSDGKGTGPLASSLKKRPADLTALAKSNSGTFPREMVAKIIDGREAVKGHGGGDMPVWGDAFERSQDAGPQAVKERIDALVEYIAGIQAK